MKDADVGVFFVILLVLPDEQLTPIAKFSESGKSLVCFRTSTHAFNYPQNDPKQELNISFGRESRITGQPDESLWLL